MFMHIVDMLLFGACAVLLLVAGLVGVLHDLLHRGPHAAPIVEDDSLDLDLPRDLDHVFWREIKTVDHLHGVPVQKREQRHAPAPE